MLYFHLTWKQKIRLDVDNDADDKDDDHDALEANHDEGANEI